MMDQEVKDATTRESIFSTGINLFGVDKHGKDFPLCLATDEILRKVHGDVIERVKFVAVISKGLDRIVG